MTEAEIIAHLQEAREFAFSATPALTCIALQGSCCLTWGGTKLETDLIFGDIDEIDGTIKVRIV